ncbi:DUF29 domain-containing protein [Sphingomonas sp.]|uniref:DUF29 domain-containing protein n=1 Tax=Sphingomonas sp. TaxID=28214 RepID=UPI0035BC4AAA
MAERDPQIVKGHNVSNYEADYGAWIALQAMLLREGRFSELDLNNLIDEVESLGRSDFHRFESALKVVLLHLIKWDIQTDHRTRSWADSIKEHRQQVQDELNRSPSYKSRIDEALPGAYRRARSKAHKETTLPRRSFPEVCPYSWVDIMERPVVWGDDESMKSSG